MKTKKIFLISMILFTFFSVLIFAGEINLEQGFYTSKDSDLIVTVSWEGGNNYAIMFYMIIDGETYRYQLARGPIKKNTIRYVDGDGKKCTISIINSTEFLDSSTGCRFKLDRNMKWDSWTVGQVVLLNWIET